MNYIKKMELLSEGFSHSQIEEMERNEVLSEGEELGYAKQLANQTAIFDELKKKHAITVYELTTNRDRTKIKYDATMASSYKEIIFGFRGKKYQYNFRYNKIKQIDGEYDINKSSWEKEQLMPSNFISDDVKWCRENLKSDKVELFYPEYNSDNRVLDDWLILKACNNHIVANSTFSWWAAWLSQNDNQIVICPQRMKYKLENWIPYSI